MQYTHRERTEKTHYLRDAIASASKQTGGSVCLDSVKGRSMYEPITLQQLNEIVEAIVIDTMYWERAYAE